MSRTMECPQCGSIFLDGATDKVHDAFIVRCRMCGLSFAASIDEIYTRLDGMSADEIYAAIGADWRMAYDTGKKLEAET